MTSVVDTDNSRPALDAAPPETTTAEAPTLIMRPKIRRRTLWNDLIETIFMVIVIYTLVNLIAPRYIVEGSSMKPNFETGEWIIVNRLPYLFGGPARGDVVILDFPEPQEDLIKRVVALPGETVAVHDGLVYVNDVAIPEQYIDEPPYYAKEAVTLGPDEFYVLGDNRNNSRDSHYFGPVTRDKIIGRALFIYWPPENWGIVPAQSYSGPAPAPLPTATPRPTPTLPPTPTIVVPSP